MLSISQQRGVSALAVLQLLCNTLTNPFLSHDPALTYCTPCGCRYRNDRQVQSVMAKLNKLYAVLRQEGQGLKVCGMLQPKPQAQKQLCSITVPCVTN
jgi:hypothetical protein